MSRIGKLPIPIPKEVDLKIGEEEVGVKGPKGELTVPILPIFDLELKEDRLFLKPKNQDRQTKALWGLFRSLINNAVIGVSKGFEKRLEIVGIGYRANLQGRTLQLSLGYSHPVNYTLPEGIEVVVEAQTRITVKGIDKQKVGQVAAEIRGFRKPEPYKGKGIRYVGEEIRRKAGKAKG